MEKSKGSWVETATVSVFTMIALMTYSYVETNFRLWLFLLVGLVAAGSATFIFRAWARRHRG